MTFLKMHFFRIILLFLLVFFSCNTTTITSNEFTLNGFDGAVVPAPLSDECLTQIDSTVSRYLSGFRFNGNVLVAYKGYPVAKYSYGYANYYTRERLNHHTLFQLASVSKAFTAMSVLMLYERGQINIYQPVQQYIPEFPFPEITIKHLLQHTSGLPNYMFYVDNYWQKDKPLHYNDVLNLLKVHGNALGFRPGRRFHYSNTGYAMLALLVEKVSGIPYYRFVKENIFNPLGMDRSFVWNLNDADTVTNVAVGFSRRGRRLRIYNHDPLDEISGDKSVFSTTADMLKWEQAWHPGKLLSDSLIQLAFTKVVTPRQRVHDYGMGWRFTTENNRQVIYHNGLWNGFTSSMSRYIEDEITIILLNNMNAPVAGIVKNLYYKVSDVVNTCKDKELLAANQ